MFVALERPGCLLMSFEVQIPETTVETVLTGDQLHIHHALQVPQPFEESEVGRSSRDPAYIQNRVLLRLSRTPLTFLTSLWLVLPICSNRRSLSYGLRQPLLVGVTLSGPALRLNMTTFVAILTCADGWVLELSMLDLSCLRRGLRCTCSGLLVVGHRCGWVTW